MFEYYDHMCVCGCGGLIEIQLHHKYYGVPRYIYGHSSRGRKPSPETIEKNRAAASTPEAIERMRAVGKANAGRKHTPEVVKKYRARNIGTKNGMWRGGVSLEEYPREFNEALRQQIRERDGNVCQCCGRTREEERQNLAVHHIDHNKENCADDNLITLCINCNGKANGNALNRHMYMRVFQQKLTKLYGYKYN